ncbi:MAG: BMP family ABC transporter substrate-binding protein [Myxococcales bacterium]|nr:BMP family ABC transporter substrate-binding protein [Myxococcales bacterium]
MKRLLLCLGLLALLGGCKKKQEAHTIGLSLDVGGRGDQSFNDGALRGLEQMAAGLRYTARGYEPLPDAEYAASLPPDLRGQSFPHLKMPPPLVLSGKAQEDYEPNLQLLVDQGVELVVAVGFMMEPAVRAVSARNPDARFLLIDSPVLEPSGKPTTVPNVRAVVFKENEGSMLAGALAGELTKTNKIGFVGGMQLPLIKKFEAGFRAGVRQVNRKADVLIAYTGTFDDEKKGVEVGQDMYGRACDIVFHAAGLDGLGVIKAAQQAGKLVIGVDSDQAHVAPKNVLTSMVKHVDIAVYLAVKDVLDGKFSGGDVVLGLREGGVGLAPIGAGLASPEAVADVEKLRAAIVAGKVAVPATIEELAKFTPADPSSLGLTHAVATR